MATSPANNRHSNAYKIYKQSCCCSGHLMPLFIIDVAGNEATQVTCHVLIKGRPRHNGKPTTVLTTLTCTLATSRGANIDRYSSGPGWLSLVGRGLHMDNGNAGA